MPSFFPDLLSFKVDFNERDPQDASRVIASRTFSLGSHIPEFGERVLLYDDEGNQCQALVREVLDPIVMVEPVAGTWRRIERVQYFGLVQSPTTVRAS